MSWTKLQWCQRIFWLIFLKNLLLEADYDIADFATEFAIRQSVALVTPSKIAWHLSVHVLQGILNKTKPKGITREWLTLPISKKFDAEERSFLTRVPATAALAISITAIMQLNDTTRRSYSFWRWEDAFVQKVDSGWRWDNNASVTLDDDTMSLRQKSQNRSR